MKKNEPLIPNDNTDHAQRGSGANTGGRTLLALVNTVGRRYRSLWSLAVHHIMALDEREWRPITFQRVKFPATLMGVSILEPVLGIKDHEFIDWVWGLRVCCGRERSAPAEFCARLAQRSVDLMLEHRQQVLDGIRERLGPHGFDADMTFRDWIVAFQRIHDLSAGIEGDCVWSAPSHPKDMKATDWQRLDAALERARKTLQETGELDVRDGSDDTEKG